MRTSGETTVMLKIVLRLILIALLAGGGYLAYKHFTFEERTENKNELVVHGNVDIREANLAFNASERIVEIAVEEGDRVEKGRVLARLRSELFELAVLRSEAQVEAQRSLVSELESGARPEEIQKARAEVEAVREKAENAERTSRRLQSLASKNLASKQDAEDAEAAAEVARAQLKAATESLNLVLAGPREEQIAAAKQKLEAYRAELRIARQNLEDTVLLAPSDGIIRNRILQVGDMAFPQKPVLTLALSDPVWVRAYVSEPELGKVRPGMKAFVKTDSFPNKSYDAWVGYISPTAEFTPKAVQTPDVRTQLVYQTRIFVCNPENQLRMGMPADVVIPLDQPSPENPDASPPPCGGSDESK